MERKEAIEIVRKLYNESLFMKKDKEAMVTLIPELKGSEDERIREEIVDYLKKFIPHHDYDLVAKSKLWIDWLEKQGKTNWKPSKEEMDALYGLSYITNEFDEQKEEIITRLYQDLKRVFFNGASFENMFPTNTSEELEKQDKVPFTINIDYMTKQEKQLLLKDLCARLPYNVNVNITYSKEHGSSYRLRICSEGCLLLNTDVLGLYIQGEIYLKPYLRPMSSMTEEELNECVCQSGIKDIECPNWQDIPKKKQFEVRLNHAIAVFLTDSNNVDWLNAHHFDYRGLISMGLALEAPEGMYQ